MKFLLTSAFMMLTLSVLSQRQYYVLIESDNNQPFYVRIGDNNYSSSSIGHLIISNLIDSAYTLEIGFPKDQYPSNQFVIRIKKKDHGYQLKNLPDKGWVLYDFQTMELIYPNKKQDGLSQTGYSLVKKNDSFAKLLSQVVNDTAVLYTLVAEKSVQPPPMPPSKKVVDSSVVKTEERPKSESSANAAIATPVVLKIAEKETDSGRQLTFLDNKDSVHIFIGAEPAQQKEIQPKETNRDDAAGSGNTVHAITPVVTDNNNKTPTSNQPIAPKEKEAITVQNKVRSDSVSSRKDTLANTSVAVHDTTASQKKVTLVNSDCKAIAWDNDVDKLRIKMLAEKDVDNKINIARKVFKTKCFSSNQIKGLSELFLTDEEKYKFLDAAYPFVVDYENFKQLSYLLSDPYYVKRFRAMVRLD
jgi:hypothetical protein